MLQGFSPFLHFEMLMKINAYLFAYITMHFLVVNGAKISGLGRLFFVPYTLSVNQQNHRKA